MDSHYLSVELEREESDECLATKEIMKRLFPIDSHFLLIDHD